MHRTCPHLPSLGFLVLLAAAPFGSLHGQTGGTCEPIAQRAGGPGVLVPGGLPMILTGTGTTIRQSLVLILQDATQPRSMLATDWTPAGLCRP